LRPDPGKNEEVAQVVVRQRRRPVAVLAVLTAALLALLAIPAFASAQNFVVNSTGDGAKVPAGAVCETATASECTLRAAIEAADFNSDHDVITFSSNVFKGALGEGEIDPATPLPSINKPVFIAAARCEEGLISKPCGGVIAPTGAAAFVVESAEVGIFNLAIGGGDVGIEVVEGEGFFAAGDWFGMNLAQQAKGSADAGLLLRSAAGAVIGQDGSGTEPEIEEEEQRNVFGHSAVGISLVGTSEATIEGNYIGVGVDGHSLTSLPVGIQIVDGTGTPATDDVIGGELTGAQASSPQCDGPCNVIVTATGGIGIELADNTGDASPSGPTTISGNYLGLSADGNSRLGTEGADIYAGPSFGGPAVGPAHVTVGGSAAVPGGSNRNVIDGDEVGVYVKNAAGFLAEGNLFGWLPGKDESGDSGPEADAFLLHSEGATEPPEITQNEMHLGPDAIGVESNGKGAGITFNIVEGSQIGVKTTGADGGTGNLIRANEISSPDRNGMLIENDANLVIGNTILGAEWAGIQLDGPLGAWAAHNRIGGDSSGEANRIEGSGEGAIQISGEPVTLNEVAGNYGSGNKGPFIVLSAHSTGHPPNDEIKPPTLEVVEESKASGTAEPGARVRIFSKASNDAGELEALIGAATANSSGHWTATYPKLAIGKLVAATQTSAPETPEGATSEVSTPKAAVADHKEEEGGSGGGGSGGGGGSTGGSSNPTSAPVTTTQPTAPKVTITKGPKKSSTSTTAKFKFRASVGGAKFECKLDRSKWAECKSPKTYKKLKVGAHTFQVRATASGLTGATTKFKFTVKT
jgi:CSLREA domain-containing protein